MNFIRGTIAKAKQPKTDRDRLASKYFPPPEVGQTDRGDGRDDRPGLYHTVGRY